MVLEIRARLFSAMLWKEHCPLMSDDMCVVLRGVSMALESLAVLQMRLAPRMSEKLRSWGIVILACGNVRR